MDVRQINRKVIEQFRAGGPVDGMHRDRLLLLTTTGRKSGQPRTTPMMFDRDGDDLYGWRLDYPDHCHAGHLRRAFGQ